jgi:N-acetylmuramoyl-L-alanine amidase
MAALFAVLIGSIGAGRFLSSGETPIASPTPQEGTTQIAAVFLTPSSTPTSSPTATPTETPTPAPTPTPDPRYIGKVVCLDPGHGGSDRGYTRTENETAPAMEEAFYNLAYARAVRFRLETLGFTVVMTRDSDIDVNASGADVNGDGKTYDNLLATNEQDAIRAKDLDELQARIDVCNDANADLLVSMHINGFPDASAQGYETWYSSARPFSRLNKMFAQLAFDELGQEIESAGYNARPRQVNDDADAHVEVAGDAFDRYVITGPAQPGQIVPSAMPGAIVEVLFISNDQDAAFLASAVGRNAIVTAYEHAIVRYFDGIAA